MEVEVVDTNPNYNILNGHSWTQAMFYVVSTLFHVLLFPHQGKIITVDQLALFSSNSSTINVPYVGKTIIPYENFKVGLFKDSSLMGTFSLPSPSNVSFVNMISSINDPWIIPIPDQVDNNYGDTMPLSPVKQAYQVFLLDSMAAFETNDQLSMVLDLYSKTPWLGSSNPEDPLNETFLTNKSIVKSCLLEKPLGMIFVIIPLFFLVLV